MFQGAGEGGLSGCYQTDGRYGMLTRPCPASSQAFTPVPVLFSSLPECKSSCKQAATAHSLHGLLSIKTPKQNTAATSDLLPLSALHGRVINASSFTHFCPHQKLPPFFHAEKTDDGETRRSSSPAFFFLLVILFLLSQPCVKNLLVRRGGFQSPGTRPSEPPAELLLSLLRPPPLRLFTSYFPRLPLAAHTSSSRRVGRSHPLFFRGLLLTPTFLSFFFFYRERCLLLSHSCGLPSSFPNRPPPRLDPSSSPSSLLPLLLLFIFLSRRTGSFTAAHN